MPFLKSFPQLFMLFLLAILSFSFLFPDPYPAAQGNLEQEVGCRL